MGTSSKGSNNAPSDTALTRAGGPWLPLQDPAKQAIGQAQQINAQGPWKYGPSKTAYMSDTQNALVAQGMGQAVDPDALKKMLASFGYSGDVASGNQVNQYDGSSAVGNVANNGIADPTNGNFDAIAANAMKGSGGIPLIQSTASGANLVDSPFLNQQVQNANRDITDQFTGSVIPGIESRMSMNGRMGSNAEQSLTGEAYKQLGSALSANENTMRGNAYNAERGYQNQAQLALPGANATELGAQTSANQAQAGDVYSRLQQQLAAANQAHGAKSADTAQALAAGQGLGTNFANTTAGTDKALEYGSIDQQNRQAAQTEASNQFQYAQSAQYDQLQRYIKSLQGIGSLQPNAANAASQESGPSGGEVAGQNAAQLAAMVAMVAMMCDARLKKNVRSAGALPNGVKLYRFGYLWDDDETERFGPMAQEVAEIMPDAVGRTESGYLYVRTGLLMRGC